MEPTLHNLESRLSHTNDIAFVALILAQNTLTFTVTVPAKGLLTTLTHKTDAHFMNQNTLDCTPKHTFGADLTLSALVPGHSGGQGQIQFETAHFWYVSLCPLKLAQNNTFASAVHSPHIYGSRPSSVWSTDFAAVQGRDGRTNIRFIDFNILGMAQYTHTSLQLSLESMNEFGIAN